MIKLILITLLSLFLNACSFSNYIPSIPTLSLITPYKADINQGSVLSRLSINQLKIGMSKKQVQEIIGAPSVIDPFHNNQWDYINHSTMGSGEVIRYRLTLKFEGLKLVNINTDGISSLPKLTDKQKMLQNARIAEEKAKILEEERIAKEEAKTKELEEKARILEEKRIAEEKAKHIAQEKIKAKELEEKNKP
ncbi:Outer membrane beta-barrel assembly protein BamE [uncultured Gammaproteobacteria bacterium]|nr:Outer membrane beta-barrel assembly protein BamE [uncultured Gammaproteobacteria bacterium]